MHLILHRARRSCKANTLSAVHFISAEAVTITAGILGKAFQNRHQESSHNLLQRAHKDSLLPEQAFLELQEALITPFWPAQMTWLDQDKHKHSNSKKTGFISSSYMYYPWLRTGGWVKRTKCKKYPCIFALFWTCCLEPWHDISRFLSFPGAFIPEYQSLKGLIFISTVLRSHNGFFFFLSTKELIVNGLKISLEKLRGESNVSFWQLYYSTLCTVWPPLFLAGSLGDEGNLLYRPRDLLELLSSSEAFSYKATKENSYTFHLVTKRTYT